MTNNEPAQTIVAANLILSKSGIRKVLVTAIAFFSLFVIAFNVAAVEKAPAKYGSTDYAGEWINNDLETQGVREVSIKAGAAGIFTITVTAACESKDCEWGEASFYYDGLEPIVSQYELPGRIVKVTTQLITNNALYIKTHTQPYDSEQPGVQTVDLLVRKPAASAK